MNVKELKSMIVLTPSLLRFCSSKGRMTNVALHVLCKQILELLYAKNHHRRQLSIRISHKTSLVEQSSS